METRKYISKTLVAFLLVATGLGCATNDSPPPAQGTVVWPDPPGDGQALLFFYTQRRDRLRTKPTIQVDDVNVFTLPEDSYSWCYVRPGVHTVRAVWDRPEISGNMARPFLFEPRGTIFLRLTTAPTGAGVFLADISQVDPVLGKLGAERCVYRVPVATKVGLP